MKTEKKAKGKGISSAAIFSVGEELLEGSIADTNSSFMARLLLEFGITPRSIAILPDDKTQMAKALAAAAKQYGLIMVTGGLGPTFDDLTMEAASEAFSLELEENEEALLHITARLEIKGLKITPAQKRQALFPKGGTVIINPVGTASALRLEVSGCLLFFLPGVPFEMEYIMTNIVVPYIKERFSLKKIYKRDFYFRAMPESIGDNAVRKIGIPQGVRCIINALPNRFVAIRVRSADTDKAQPFIDKLLSELSSYYIGISLKSSAQRLAQVLLENSLTFAAAESCTGGLVGAKLTEIPGISKAFKGGVVSYVNEIKNSLLEVSEETLRLYGAVSRETAIEMVYGVKKLFNTSTAIAVTGYAGSAAVGNAITTEDASKANIIKETTESVGLVFAAALFGEKMIYRRFTFSGSRNEIREQAAESALELACKLIYGEL
jgi:nicotinamide-nucleotide amidase